MTGNRNLNIDLIRILSIIIVICSHFRLLEFPHFDGTLGVVLFFMVSGYCISLTAPRKNGFLSFWKARYLRLLPLFFVCTLVIQLFKLAFPDAQPERMTTWRQYLFTNVSLPAFDIPTYLYYGGDYTFVDGSFWSLLVEFRYYLLFSVLWYFLRLRKTAVFALLAASLLCFYTDKYYSDRVNDFFMYLPYFSFGMSFYEFEKGSKKIGFAGGLLSISVFAMMGYFEAQHVSFSLNHDDIYTYLSCFFVFLAIMLLFKNKSSQSAPFITKLAVLTYPIYLLHQEMGYIYIELLRYDLGVFGAGLAAAFAAVLLAYLIDLIVNFLMRPLFANNRV